jgi:hypothetical protein
MPIQTDLNRAPYYDDYSEKDNYHRILFKPSVAVQVRELNQLQTILQNQVERFGDNIYRRGTIIDGCNFIFHNDLPFIKINDQQTDGAPVNVSSFKGLFVKNRRNLVAQIVETSTGFEATAPNLNTLHVKYLNSGVSGKIKAFTRGQTLTVYDPAMVVTEADVVVKASAFSNNDNLVILSAVEIQNTEGGSTFVNASGQACTFLVGDVITQEQTGAQAEVREVNTTANVSTLILKIRPLANNLRLANTVSWLFADGYRITSSNTYITGVVKSKIGKDASGTIVTDSIGGIKSVAILNGGTGYYVEPYITVAYSTPNTNPSLNGTIDSLNISCKNFKCNVTINDSLSSIGTGVGFSVSDGIIYQKGHFVRVDEQFIVVDKYNNQTNNVVGFDTKEDIITFRVDQNLLDNAGGSFNRNAPGADRLKLTPVLVVKTKSEADANNLFLPIVEYSLGKPARQRKQTQFNSISKELAQRTFEQSGNYVLDQFLVSTEDIDVLPDGTDKVRVRVDPGTAYIGGYRVQTFAPYAVDMDRGVDIISKSSSVDLNYGNYVRLKEVAGLFKFSVGAIVSLRNTAKTYITSSTTASVSTNQFPTISAAGSEIGTARIRSMTLESGTPGESSAVYRLYLFDIRMNKGNNFAQVKSMFYDGSGTNDGIGDVILDSKNQASLVDVRSSTLLFPTGLKALRSTNNISYTYRTISDNSTCNTAGFITVSVAQNPGEYFPYGSTLSVGEKETIILTPLANTQASANATGAANVTSAGFANVIGVGTSFNSELKVGDYIRLANSVAAQVKRVVKIANATHLTVDSGFANAYTGANVALYFPQFVPITLAGRIDRPVTVTSNTNLNISIGNTIPSQVSMAVAFDVKRTANVIPKTVIRNAFVKINTLTNVANSTGPWCLGFSDIVRLRNVYVGRTVAFGGNSSVIVANTITYNNTYFENNDEVTYLAPTTVDTTNGQFISFSGNTTSVLQGNATANGFLILGTSNVSQLSASQAVKYIAQDGNTAITPLANNTTYYVVVANSTAIQLAATAGGAAINLTSVPTSSQPGHLISTGNNALRNLANGTNYYVINATSTGFKLATSRNGTEIELLPTFKDTTHSFQVIKTTDESAMSNFWIDHNQKKDYYDLGFLYKKPTFALPPNATLLVKFDVLRTTQEGLKTITSYPINDTLHLKNNASALHTLEIPEVIHDNGDYYDLRDSLDFRPYSTNTANYVTNFRNATVNPTEPTPSTRFNSTIDKKFPSPSQGQTKLSLCDFVVEKYLPRIDSLVLSGNGEVNIIRGNSSETPKEPKISNDYLLLNNLIVSEYPSVPHGLNGWSREYLDTKTININRTRKRINDFTISTPISPSGLRYTQNKPYTMKDIASLERRIADLEYYTSLSFTEDTVNNLQLKSSVDSGTNRFKFGFYVDNFTTSNYADINDPSYFAQIYGFELHCAKRNIALKYKFNTLDTNTRSCLRGNKIMLPSTEKIIINQNKATESTTVDVAVTETTFTTTGTEITNTQTNVYTLTTEEYSLLSKEYEGQIQTSATTTTASTTTTTRQRTIIRDVRGPDFTFGESIFSNVQPNEILLGFTASRFGGKISTKRNGSTSSSGIVLERYVDDEWTIIQNDSGGGNAYSFINYTYNASEQTQFRIRSAGTGEITLLVTYPTSTQETDVETFQDTPTTSTASQTDTSYNPFLQTIYKVDKVTNTTTKTEVIPKSTIIETTTSVTKSLFNPKPTALMQMDQLFNLPGTLNSPTVDLLRFIQEDINS